MESNFYIQLIYTMYKNIKLQLTLKAIFALHFHFQAHVHILEDRIAPIFQKLQKSCIVFFSFQFFSLFIHNSDIHVYKMTLSVSNSY